MDIFNLIIATASLIVAIIGHCQSIDYALSHIYTNTHHRPVHLQHGTENATESLTILLQ